jgi:hypothetical protein
MLTGPQHAPRCESCAYLSDPSCVFRHVWCLGPICTLCHATSTAMITRFGFLCMLLSATPSVRCAFFVAYDPCVTSMAWTMLLPRFYDLGFYGLNCLSANACFYFTRVGHYKWYLVPYNELSRLAVNKATVPRTHQHTTRPSLSSASE